MKNNNTKPKPEAENSDNTEGTTLKTYLSDQELEYFKELILRKRSEAVEEVEQMQSRLQDAQEQAEGYTYHMADTGTDAMEREMLYLMISRQQKFIGYLDRALKRIENKTYGICKLTGQQIPKERLEAVPHTETTVQAKLQEKKKIGSVQKSDNKSKKSNEDESN